METSNLPQVRTLKEMWKTFDINAVNDSLHEQVSYSSPSSLTWIGGKENVLKYFQLVMEGSHLLNIMMGVDMKFKVVRNSKNDHSLIVSQIEDDTETKCRFQVSILEDKIFCIDMEPIN